MKKMQRMMACILAAVLVLGLIPTSAGRVSAEGADTIELGTETWFQGVDGDMVYSFADVKVNFSGGKKIFCLSVDGEGSFELKDEEGKYAENGFIWEDDPYITFSGIEQINGEAVYAETIKSGHAHQYTSMTVSDRSDHNDMTAERIEAFLKSLVFHRNGASNDTVHNVTAAVSDVKLGDNMTAMAVDGTIHYYKYVTFEAPDGIYEEYGSTPGGWEVVAQYEQTSTWYDAYNRAKEDKVDNMKGYLATITSDDEQFFVYNELGKKLQAWIGGARILNGSFPYDANIVADGALKPADKYKDNNPTAYADTWYWLCGPEAGKEFYKNEVSADHYEKQEAIPGIYQAWNKEEGQHGEPNNRYSSDEVTDAQGQVHNPDPYGQEYALEYGYVNRKMNWNDYSPYNIRRDEFGIKGYLIEYSPYGSYGSGSFESIEPSDTTLINTKPVSYAAGLSITAKDFIIKRDEISALTGASTKTKAAVVAKKDGAEVSENSTNTVTVTNFEAGQKALDNGADEYEFTYAYVCEDPDHTGRAQATAKALAVDVTSGPQTGTDGHAVEIGAQEITVKESEILGKDDESETLKQLLKELGKPVATDNGKQVDFDKIKVSKVDLYDDTTGKLKTETDEDGPYVIFEYDGATVLVPVKVTKDIEEGQKYPLIEAQDFIIKDTDTNRTDGDIIKHSDAQRYTELTEYGKSDEVKVTSGGDALRGLKEPGTVPITLGDNTDDTETADPKTVTAYVVNEVSSSTDVKPSDSKKNVSIGANHITVTVEEAARLMTDSGKLKEDTKVVALSEGEKVTPDKITVAKNEIQAKTGEYEVVFAHDGITVQVIVTVTGTAPATDTVITAKDFEISAGGDELTPDTFKDKAAVTAKDGDGKDVTPTVDPDDLKKLNDIIKNKQPGTEPEKVPVKVITPDGTTKTVQVTVKAPEGSPSQKPADTIGTDQTYEISNPKDVPQELDPGREVTGVTIDGVALTPNDYTVNGTNMTIKSDAMKGKEPGTYTAVITYKDGSTRTFKINVVNYDADSVVPLSQVPIFNMQKDIGVGMKFKLNLVGMNENAYIDPANTKSSNTKIATIDPKTLVIKAKKKGTCTINAAIIQNGSYYSVKIKLVVKKKMTMYNLKNAALVKQQGVLPEFNVYKRVVKGKKTKLKFTQVAKGAKITYKTSNKKVATISKKGVIKGKKKGFAKITAIIEQNGHTYYTRLFVRVDDGTKNKQIKKYLTTKAK